MTKAKFIEKYKGNQLNIGNYNIELNSITDASFVMGCVHDDGVWKIFKTTERTVHYIIKELSNEDAAFDYFYELVLIQHNTATQSY